MHSTQQTRRGELRVVVGLALLLVYALPLFVPPPTPAVVPPTVAGGLVARIFPHVPAWWVVFDYSTWRTAPRCPELEEFVTAVKASWRDNGGEPDIALSIPRWLEEMGFEVRSASPIVDVVEPGQMKWTWLRSFINVGRQRLVDLGYLTAGRAGSIWNAFTAFEASEGARMISPGVLEIVAARNGDSQ